MFIIGMKIGMHTNITRLLEMWLRLGQTKNKSSPTWRQEENELNPAWRQNETGQGIKWRQTKKERNFSAACIQNKKGNKFTSRTQTYYADKKLYDARKERYHSHK